MKRIYAKHLAFALVLLTALLFPIVPAQADSLNNVAVTAEFLGGELKFTADFDWDVTTNSLPNPITVTTATVGPGGPFLLTPPVFSDFANFDNALGDMIQVDTIGPLSLGGVSFSLVGTYSGINLDFVCLQHPVNDCVTVYGVGDGFFFPDNGAGSNIVVTAIPTLEPSTILLTTSGLFALSFLRLRRNSLIRL